MNGHAFRAMGTDWWIAADRVDLLGEAERRVRDVEARLTRFSPDSALSALNRDRRSEDAMLRAVVGAALRLQAATGGAFDPSMGRDLAALGYDRPFRELGSTPGTDAGPPPGARSIHLTPTGVVLDGSFDLDLGGIGKGWAVDDVHDWLRVSGAAQVLVDGGGDVRGSGRVWPIGVEDGGAVELCDGALATSSTLGRRWTAPDGTPRHHVLDPRTRAPSASAAVVATVRAPNATLADALATALLVDPAGVVPRLARFDAAALVRDADGQWWASPTWRAA